MSQHTAFTLIRNIAGELDMIMVLFGKKEVLLATGKPIQHKDLISLLSAIIQLPASVSVIQCAAHTKGRDDVSLGNETAAAAAQREKRMDES